MPSFSFAATVAERIQRLIEERQKHADAIIQIDETLERVGAALGDGAVRRGRPRKAVLAISAPEGSFLKQTKRGRRRGKFATSAEESILSFVKEHKNPATQELKKHWASEGRGGTADNALSKLVKERKLKRIPLEGQRGSRFTLI